MSRGAHVLHSVISYRKGKARVPSSAGYLLTISLFMSMVSMFLYKPPDMMVHTSLKQNTPHTSAYKQFHRYASDTPRYSDFKKSLKSVRNHVPLL